MFGQEAAVRNTEGGEGILSDSCESSNGSTEGAEGILSDSCESSNEI